jgi:hypothetical protein
MRRTCAVSDAQCLAPAGYRAGSGIMEGDKSCRGTCRSCGEPVCANCSRRVGRHKERICENCITEVTGEQK